MKQRIYLPVEEIIEKRKRGKNLIELAQEYGVSPTLIRTRIKEYCEKKGLGIPNFKIQLPIEEIIERLANKETQEKLAQEYGVSSFTINERIYEYYKEKGQEKPDLRKLKKELPIEEIMEKRKRGVTIKLIAEEYGVSTPTIYKRIKEHYEIKGEEKPDFRIKLPIEEIIEKRKKGATIKLIAKEYGVSTSTINKRIKEHYEIKGEEKPDFRIKLPIEVIIEKRKAGATIKLIAEEYGLSESNIRKRIKEFYEENDEGKPDLRKSKIELPIEEIIEKRKRGMTLKELAQEYNVSEFTIGNRINYYYIKKGEEKPDLRKLKKELPIEEIIEKRKRGATIKVIAEDYEVSKATISKRINKYYNSNQIKQHRILKRDCLVVEYLKKGLTPEQIREVAKNSKIIIPQSVMDSAIAKVEGQKTIQSEEERDK